MLASTALTVRTPYLATPPARMQGGSGPVAPASSPLADAHAAPLDQAALQPSAADATTEQVPVLQDISHQLGIAVTLGLSIWGAVSPAIAAEPPPRALPTSQSAQATPAAAPQVQLSRRMRAVKAELDACAAKPQSFDHVIDAFGQGREGNCSAIAIIKAAMHQFGTGALKRFEPTPEGYAVTTRAGFKTTISFAELEQAIKESHFDGHDDRATAFAHLCYATMAKAAVLYELDGSHTFKEALKTLGSPQKVETDGMLLGLRTNLKPVEIKIGSADTKPLAGHHSLIGISTTHAVFIDEKAPGKYEVDHYGGSYDFRGTDTNQKPIVWMFSVE